MALEIVNIQNKVTDVFGNSVSNFGMQRDVFCLEVTSEKAYDLVKFLKEDADLNFHFLTDLAGIHYPDNEKTQQFAFPGKESWTREGGCFIMRKNDKEGQRCRKLTRNWESG